MQTTVVVLLALFLLTCFSSAYAFDADYYVDNTVSDCSSYNAASRSCGSGEKQVFDTIQEAVDVAQAGETVAVRQGRYHEEISLKRSGNSADGYITYRSYPGERVEIDGSVSLSGWQKCNSQNDCLGNPNWQNIYYTDLPKYMKPDGAIVYENNQISKIAMYPDQTDRVYIDDTSEFKAFERLEGCSAVSVKDPEFLTVENLPYWENSYVSLLHGNNIVITRKINDFEASENRVVFDAIDCVDSYNKYAIMNNILALSRPGEFYIHNYSGSYKIFYWPYESINNDITYSDLTHGFNLWGYGHIIIDGFEIKKMAITDGDYRPMGKAIISYPGKSGPFDYRIIRNNIIYGMKSRAITLSYCSNCLVENNNIFDSYDSGIAVTGSWSEGVYLYNSSINNNRIEKVQGTAIDYYAAIDSSITNNTIIDCTGHHGNSITVYEGSKHVLIENNYIYDSSPMTFNNGQDHVIRGNFHNSGGISCWSSPQENYLIEQNTFMGLISCSSSLHKGFTIRDNIAGSISSNSNNFTYKNNIYLELYWNRPESALDESELYYPYPERLFVNYLEDDYRPIDISPACNMSTTGSYVGKFPCVPLENCNDSDGDNFYEQDDSCASALATDCNDSSSSVYPGAQEVCGNGIDEDCLGGDKKCPAIGNVLKLDFENSLQDTSGYNIPVEWTVTERFGEGKFGLGANLDKETSLFVPDLSQVIPPDNDHNLTIVLWAKNYDPSFNNQYILNSSGANFSMRTYNGVLRACYSGSNCNNIGSINENEWYHIALTVDGTKWTYYLNGTVAGTSDKGYGVKDFSEVWGFYIGGQYFSLKSWDGVVDEVKVYNTALADKEILALYEGNQEVCISLASLLNYISEWMEGNIEMAHLLQKIKEWKQGTGCQS